MATQKVTFSEARNRFIKALADYQTATRDLNVALHRVNGHTAKVFRSLQTVVDASGPLTLPRR